MTADQLNQLNRLLNLSKNSNMGQTHMSCIICAYNVIINDDNLIVDSGASYHFTQNAKLLMNVTELAERYMVKLPNGQVVEVKYNGSCRLNDNLLVKGAPVASEQDNRSSEILVDVDSEGACDDVSGNPEEDVSLKTVSASEVRQNPTVRHSSTNRMTPV